MILEQSLKMLLTLRDKLSERYPTWRFWVHVQSTSQVGIMFCRDEHVHNASIGMRVELGMDLRGRLDAVQLAIVDFVDGQDGTKKTA